MLCTGKVPLFKIILYELRNLFTACCPHANFKEDNSALTPLMSIIVKFPSNLQPLKIIEHSMTLILGFYDGARLDY